MATFGQLRKAIFREAGVRNHFEFMELGQEYQEFHREINSVEFRLGHTPAYTQPGTPALCEMELLSEAEFAEWLERFRKINKQ